MSIRNRVTLWFAGILVVCLGVMVGVFQHELGETQRQVRSGQPLDPAWEETGEVLLYVGLPTSLLLLVGGSWLLRRSLLPISRLTEAVEHVRLDRLPERLPLAGTGDELDRLTEVFNAMTVRLQESFAQVRDFTLHASHELKTPLTIMQGQLETALDDPVLTPEQRDLIVGQLDEIQRMARIVDSLSLLARADAGQAQLRLEPVRLDELVQDSFADAQVLARPHAITVTLSACEPVSLQGDPSRLRQLLLNLTDNAIKHNQPNGRVEMALRQRENRAELRFENTGPGLTSEQLPRVFDRFFRGDPAHGTNKEGCGLGLTIAQWIVQAHGGTIRLDSRPREWTRVEVSFPVLPAGNAVRQPPAPGGRANGQGTYRANGQGTYNVDG